MPVIPASTPRISDSVDPGEIVSIESPGGETLKGRLWHAAQNAPLLVAAHGVMSHSLWFHQLAETLGERGISLLAFDRRGAGMNREEPGEPEDDRTLIGDLSAWVDFATTISDDLHLVGFCWGSNYALHYLGHRPDAIRSLILIAPGVVPSAKIKIYRSTDDVAPDDQVPIPLRLEDFTQGPALEGFLRPDPLRLTHTSMRFVGIQNQIGRWSAVRLAKLDLPLLVILAEQDDISDNAKIKTLFDKSKASPKMLIEVPGLHGVIFDAPDPIAIACQRWLDDASA